MTESSESPSKSLMDSSSNKDKVALKLIRVTGETHTFYFLPATSATSISTHVFNNWPEAWTEGSGNSASVLRLLYQGRFLHGNTTLAGLKLPIGKTTVMHLVSRETVPEPQSAAYQKSPCQKLIDNSFSLHSELLDTLWKHGVSAVHSIEEKSGEKSRSSRLCCNCCTIL